MGSRKKRKKGEKGIHKGFKDPHPETKRYLNGVYTKREVMWEYGVSAGEINAFLGRVISQILLSVNAEILRFQVKD